MMNVRSVDRVLRIVTCLSLLILPLLPQVSGYMLTWGAWKYAITAVGLVMLLTAAFRTCPAYSLFGINTCHSR